MSMEPRFVLVTGGAGFIGRWVVKELLGGGSGQYRFSPPQVVVVDNFENSSKANLEEFNDDPNLVRLVEGDIQNRELMRGLFEQYPFDLIFHLAAKINVQDSINDPSSVFEADVVGTFYLLELARQSQCRFVFMSTCMVYERSAEETGIDEKHPTLCSSPYAGAKLAAEKLVESYHRAYDLPTVILRPFNTFGPFQKTTGEGGVVSIFLYRELSGTDLQIYGDGTQTRDLLFVEDCAAFTVQAALSDDVIGLVINAGTGADVTINELAEIICADQKRIKHVPHIHPQSEIKKLQANTELAGTALGWKPTVSLTEGIRRTQSWIKKQKQN